MTAIGRALMSRPRLLVLDEPSMRFALLVVQDVFLALKKLNRETGLSILIAAVALKYADHATVLENGRPVRTAAELRQREDVRAFFVGQPASPATQPPHLHAVA